MTNERSRAATLRANDRIRFFSTVCGNLGAALLATAIGRWFLTGFDLFALLWLLVSVGLMWMGWYVLTMLEAEEQ